MSLWGGFTAPINFDDRGLEKRLQFDFRKRSSSEVTLPVSVSDVVAVMKDADQVLLRHEHVSDALETVTLSDSLAVVMPSRLLVTSSSSVMLHQVLQSMLALFAQRGLEVEWASFVRKNMVSPWQHEQAPGETSDIMAQEYADLKAAFPQGKSFITGPVDREHYFHFVFDDVIAENQPEVDTQFNLYLYDVECLGKAIEGEVDCCKQDQRLIALTEGKEGYEMQRVFADVRCVSFETNDSLERFTSCHLPAMLEEFGPQRFTLVAFQDRDASEGDIRRAFNAVKGYGLTNRTINYVSEGYAYHHLSFERA